MFWIRQIQTIAPYLFFCEKFIFEFHTASYGNLLFIDLVNTTSKLRFPTPLFTVHRYLSH